MEMFLVPLNCTLNNGSDDKYVNPKIIFKRKTDIHCLIFLNSKGTRTYC